MLAQLGRGGSERPREARRELLQRTLFITLDDIRDASHDGVLVELGGDLSAWCAFPQLVCYSGDYPEKRAVLCLRGIRARSWTRVLSVFPRAVTDKFCSCNSLPSLTLVYSGSCFGACPGHDHLGRRVATCCMCRWSFRVWHSALDADGRLCPGQPLWPVVCVNRFPRVCVCFCESLIECEAGDVHGRCSSLLNCVEKTATDTSVVPRVWPACHSQPYA